MSLLYDSKKQEYLIQKDYDIALSSGLQLTAPKPLTKEPIKVLAAGVTRDFPEYRFPPIPKVADELETIKNIFDKSEILLNRDFTQNSLQQKLQESDFPVVHLATHGQFGSTSDQTFILSGAETGNPLINVNQFNNLLQVGSLRRSQPIELLVLSACNTGRGRITGDGVIGLSRSFIAAGIPTVVVSLWAVPDAPTEALMVQFYKLWQEGVGKAYALRQAMIEMIVKHPHPKNWGAFIVLGTLT